MQKYKVEFYPEDQIYVVTNPNNGPDLRFSANSGLQLLTAEDGAFLYAFKDLNRNGILDPYEDWRLSPEARARDLAQRLSLDRLCGAMLHPVCDPGDGTLRESVLAQLDQLFVRFFLANGTTVANALTFNNAVQAHVEANDPLGIPVNISSDPRNTLAGGRDTVYQDTDMSGWPGNLGLAATFDPENALIHGQVTSQEYRAFGIHTALSPQVDLGTEPRWRRYCGTFGEGSKLCADMAQAYIRGFQSTWSGLGSDAEDLGWGKDSVVTMVKHFPGDGAPEAGREAHNHFGKYNVYPGQNQAEHAAIFEKAIHIPESKTGGAAAVMPSYSIGIGAYCPVGRPVGSGFSAYKLKTLLREQMHFDGLICSDWGIGTRAVWGVEEQSVAQRHYTAICAGLNMFGGSNDARANLAAFRMGVSANCDCVTKLPGEPVFPQPDQTNSPEDPEEFMERIYRENAQKALETSFKTGLFEAPYVICEASRKILGCPEFRQLGLEVQKRSVVMLKNRGNLIRQAPKSRRTVYIPMVFSKPHLDWAGPHPYRLYTPFETCPRLAEYFHVVTDTLRPDADPAHPQQSDIIRRTDFSGVDFVLCTIDNPKVGDGFDRNGVVPGAENGYLPISLQYRPYFADPAVVRPHPIALDPLEELEWTSAGGEAGKSRYYGGKTVTAENEYQLDQLLEIRKNTQDLPLLLYITATNPMCFYEVEPLADAILMGFSISEQAALEVIGGRYEPSGLLPMQMPKTMETVERQQEDVPFDMEVHVDTEGHAYDYGFGMNWSGVISDWRTDRYGRG